MDKSKKTSRIVMSSVILVLLVFSLVLIIVSSVPDHNLISYYFNSDVNIFMKLGALPFVVIMVLLIVGIVKMVKVVISYATSKGDLIKMNVQIKSSANKFITCFVLAIVGALLMPIFYQFMSTSEPSEKVLIELSMGGYSASGYFLVFMIASLILSSILRKGNKKEFDETHVAVEKTAE